MDDCILVTLFGVSCYIVAFTLLQSTRWIVVFVTLFYSICYITLLLSLHCHILCSQSGTKVKHYIRQKCAAAILRVLESAASAGVRCRLRNIRGEEVERILFPRLVAMNFDQPEAQLFFGLQNKTSCSKCKRRKGYSAFRRGSLQKGTEVHRLYEFANDRSNPFNKTAREKLKRWGFNHTRRCCLTDVCDKLLVRIPGRDEVYPCVDYRDGMHGLMIFIHRIIMCALDDLKVPYNLRKNAGIISSWRKVMDQRLSYLAARRCFRDAEGKAYRVQRSCFNDAGMTAKDRVCMVFLLAHVLGPTADILPDPGVRSPFLTALAHAQVIIVAARGLRTYTVPELQNIFDRGFVSIFGALESIREITFKTRTVYHQQEKSDKPPPKRFKRQTRFATSHCNACYSVSA